MCITFSLYSFHHSCRLHLKACGTLSTAQKLVSGLPRTKAISLDVSVVSSRRHSFAAQLRHISKRRESKKIAAQDLMAAGKPLHVMNGYDFVAYANRGSLPFRENYNIPEAHTMIRGSLRYKGNPASVKALIDLGWVNIEQKDWLKNGLSSFEIWQKMTNAEKSNERFTHYFCYVIII